MGTQEISNRCKFRVFEILRPQQLFYLGKSDPVRDTSLRYLMFEVVITIFSNLAINTIIDNKNFNTLLLISI